MKKLTRISLGIAVSLFVLTGCRFEGVNSLPLPGTAIQGDSFTVVVEMRDIQNLVNNSVVKAGNVNVGAIRRVELDEWTARLTVELSASADLPANVSAKLGQTSILGAQYLALDVPEGEEPETRRLGDGDLITLDRTDEYPTTDAVLAAVSAVLNGGGLEQVRTITAELNHVMDGRTDTLRALIDNLQTFVGGLNDQRDDIVRAIDSIDKMSMTLGAQTATIDKGISTLAPALGVLDQQQTELVNLLDSLGRFGDAADNVLGSSHADLVADLENLQPVLTELAAAGSNVPDALDVALTIPWSVSTVDRAIRGDYINLYLTVDLSANGVLNKVLPSIPKGILESITSATQAVNPLLAPVRPQLPPLPQLPAIPGIPGIPGLPIPSVNPAPVPATPGGN